LGAIIVSVVVGIREDAAVNAVLIAERLGECESALQGKPTQAEDFPAQLEAVVTAVVDRQIGGRTGERGIWAARLDIARACAGEIQPTQGREGQSMLPGVSGLENHPLSWTPLQVEAPLLRVGIVPVERLIIRRNTVGRQSGECAARRESCADQQRL